VKQYKALLMLKVLSLYKVLPMPIKFEVTELNPMVKKIFKKTTKLNYNKKFAQLKKNKI